MSHDEPKECCGNPSCDGVSRAPKVEPLPLDDARMEVCQGVMNSLRKSISDLEAASRGATGVEKENAQRVVFAAEELFALLKTRKKNFSTPRILRPQRSLKVFRG